MTILTIWHNNVSRPILVYEAGVTKDGREYPAFWYEGRSGLSPFDPDSETTVAEFRRTIEKFGHAIVVSDRHQRPLNHHIIGIGVGHDDADWAESRFQEGSAAAWSENGGRTNKGIHVEPWGGREPEAIRIMRRDRERQELHARQRQAAHRRARR